MGEFTGYSYQLQPHTHQVKRMTEYAGAVRWVWNQFLSLREDALLAAKSAGGKLSPGQFNYVANARYLTTLRHSTSWLAATNCEIQQQVLRDQDKAFLTFFRGGGFPKFKSRHDRQSFRFPAIKAHWVKGDKIKLPGIGWVKFRLSRPITGEIRNVTISLDAGKWSIAFCLKGDYQTANAGAEPIGMDLGSIRSVVLNTGKAISFPVRNDRETAKVRFLQRKIERQSKGSVRRRRTMGRLSRLNRHVVNRVKDVQHKTSTRLSQTHRLIAIEDLGLMGMTRSARGTAAKPGKNVAARAGVNRSILANGHARFKTMLEYKCARSGAQLISVPAAHTSQKCSCCGHTVQENRKSQADFECVVCGHQANADVNAAINILAAGLVATARGGMDIGSANESRSQGGIEA